MFQVRLDIFRAGIIESGMFGSYQSLSDRKFSHTEISHAIGCPYLIIGVFHVRVHCGISSLSTLSYALAASSSASLVAVPSCVTFCLLLSGADVCGFFESSSVHFGSPSVAYLCSVAFA